MTHFTGPLSIGGYQEHEDVEEEDDDDDAIIDVEDYKIPPVSVSLPSTQSPQSSASANSNQTTPPISTHKNRIGRPTKASMSSPVSSSTASDDERLSPDSVKVSFFSC